MVIKYLFVVMFVFLQFGCGGDNDEGASLNDEGSSLSSQNDENYVTWEVTFGDDDADEGNSVIALDDSTYIVAGYAYSEANLSTDVAVLLINEQGDLVWEKTYGGDGIDKGHSIRQTSDGGFIITGETWSFGAGANDVYLLKLDSEGNMLWDNHFGGGANDEGYSVEETIDGGFIVAGTTGSFGSRYQYYLIKTDSQGDLEWEKTFSGYFNQFGECVIETNDGGYVISGYGPLIKVDSDGNIVWETPFDGSARCVVPTSDGGYIVTGDDDIAAYIAKYDSNGSLLWDNTFGGGSYVTGSSIQETDNGDYIICGSGDPFSPDTKLFIVKINQDGNLLWEKTYGEYATYGNEVAQTDDGGYVAVGRSSLSPGPEGDIYLIKTDPDGNIE